MLASGMGLDGHKARGRYGGERTPSCCSHLSHPGVQWLHLPGGAAGDKGSDPREALLPGQAAVLTPVMPDLPGFHWEQQHDHGGQHFLLLLGPGFSASLSLPHSPLQTSTWLSASHPLLPPSVSHVP